MKQLIRIILFLAVLCSAFSCRKGSYTDPLIGTWSLYGAYNRDGTFYLETYDVDEYSNYTFYEDGTYLVSSTQNGAHSETQGNYIFDGKDLILYPQDSSFSLDYQYWIISKDILYLVPTYIDIVFELHR